MSLLFLYLVELCAVALLFIISFFLLHRRMKTSSKQNPNLPPSPPRIPIIGNLHQLGSLPHRSLHALSKKHGPLMLIHLGHVPTLVVSSPEAARDVMKNHDPIFASRPQLKVAQTLFKGGMDLSFAPYGTHWRHTRKLCVTHLLSTKRVQAFSRAREEEVALMMDKISNRASSKGVVDMSEVLNSFSNDVVCRAVSGKFPMQGRNEIFRKLIQETSILFGEFHVEDLFPYLGWMNVFFGTNARAERNAKKWHEVLDEVIKGHADRARGGYETFEDLDFVDVLLSLREDSEIGFDLTIKNVIMDMFAAGTDTSYILLEWAMVELVRHDKVMKIIQGEVRGIMHGKEKVQEEDLSEMKYLKVVLKEVLRLHPPVPLLLPRESMEDCKLQDYIIPKKTRIIINAWSISMDSKFWEAPEEFRPERFIDSPIDFNGNDFQFIPFGAGRRICPGLNFAMITAELALANLINQFEWELPNGMTRDNLDMTESFGLTMRRKQKLELIAKSYSYYK